MIKKYFVIALLCIAPFGRMLAQDNGPDKPGRGTEAGAPGPRPNRMAMERRFKQRLAQVVKDRLSLTDDQMSKLQAVDSRLEVKRRMLFQREITVRKQLRSELDATNPDQPKIEKLLAETLKLQDQKAALFREEDQEMAKFLTPAQRAQYFGIQSQVRERVERAFIEGGPRGRGRGPGGPGGPSGEPGGPDAPPEPFALEF